MFGHELIQSLIMDSNRAKCDFKKLREARCFFGGASREILKTSNYQFVGKSSVGVLWQSVIAEFLKQEVFRHTSIHSCLTASVK